MRTHEDYYQALKESDFQVERAAKTLGVSVRRIMVMKRELKTRGYEIPDSLYNIDRVAFLQNKERAEREGKREFSVPVLPDKDRPIEEIIRDRKREYVRTRSHEEARKLIEIKVKIPGPIAINLQGDPHLDDPGCDIEAIETDCTLVNKTEGMMAGCIGDLQNNWVGRLAKLYGQQTTTAREAWKLVEWYIKLCPQKWLFVIAGNHDLWQGGDLLKWITRHEGVIAEDHQVRFALKFPSGKEVRLAARHDWPGQSMWNPTHGGLRAARFTVHDHIIVSGHRHSGGYQKTYIEGADVISHIIQLGAYKIYDEYRNEKGFNRFQISPSTTVVIDPEAEPKRMIHVYDDTSLAADFLRFLRKRK